MKRPSEMTLGTMLLALGAFAGFCFGRFTSNLVPKEFKEFAIQWDIGNTVVGIATTFIALTSIWIALTNKRRDGVQKIAEFRKDWLEIFRNEVALFIATARSIHSGSHIKKFNKDNFDYYEEITTKLDEIGIRLTLMLNPEHDIEIIELIDNIHNDVIKSVSKNTDPELNEDEIESISKNISKYLEEMQKMCHLVEKTEWRRLKTEIKEGT